MKEQQSYAQALFTRAERESQRVLNTTPLQTKISGLTEQERRTYGRLAVQNFAAFQAIEDSSSREKIMSSMVDSLKRSENARWASLFRNNKLSEADFDPMTGKIREEVLQNRFSDNIELADFIRGRELKKLVKKTEKEQRVSQRVAQKAEKAVIQQDAKLTANHTSEVPSGFYRTGIIVHAHESRVQQVAKEGVVLFQARPNPSPEAPVILTEETFPTPSPRITRVNERTNAPTRRRRLTWAAVTAVTAIALNAFPSSTPSKEVSHETNEPQNQPVRVSPDITPPSLQAVKVQNLIDQKRLVIIREALSDLVNQK